VVYPAPPDTPRIQFLTHITASRDLEARRSFFETLVGVAENEVELLVKPFGVAVEAGRIYICDTVFRGVRIIDLEHGRFRNFRPPDLPARMQVPVGCALDKEYGRLYVVDTGRRVVLVFNAELAYVTAISGPVGFRPNDVAVDAEGIWVSDASSHVIRVYDKKSFAEKRAIPQLDPKHPGFLHQPTNLHITGDKVYVTDFGDFTVKVYSRAGEYLTAVGSYGDGAGRFTRPKGIAVDRDSVLYVADAAFNNVQLFNAAGAVLMFFGGSSGGPGSMSLPAQIALDYENLDYFRRYVDDSFDLLYLIFVTNQYGPAKLGVYGFIRPKG
jgi:DNA-binding beta-propeller fold protein YncE